MNEKQICKLFLQNPEINPKTGRKIIKGKATYHSLVKLCEKHNMVHLPPKKYYNKPSSPAPLLKTTYKLSKFKPVAPKQSVPVNPPTPIYTKKTISAISDNQRLKSLYDVCTQNYFNLPQNLQRALTEYQGVSYQNVNQLLWSQQGKVVGSGQFQSLIKSLFSIFKNGHALTAQNSFYSYRNFGHGGVNPVTMSYINKMKALAVGHKVPFYGFLSLSATEDANPIYGKVSNIAVIIVPKGAKYICPSQQNIQYTGISEEEIILQPGYLEKIENDNNPANLGIWVYIPHNF